MNLRQLIPTDVTASAMAHLSLLVLLLLFSDVRPFGAVTADTVAVDIVTPQEMAEKQVAEITPEPTPTPPPQPDFSLLEKPATASTPAPSQPPASQAPAPARLQMQAALAAKPPAQQQVAQPQPASPPPAPPAPPVPAYTPPEPDLTIKYHVLLGLPQDLPSTRPPAPSQSSAKATDNKAADNFDAPAVESADIASSLITEFRRHLRTCSKLPADLKATDDVKVKLRVFMTQDGKLATDPVLIEASASMKGPLLMQGAIRALQACQPYAMLPPDRYGEWKVLDLSFTARDFAS